MQSELNKVCQQQQYSDYFRNYFPINSSESIMIEVLLPFSSICCILNIFFFCKFPNARQPPFDILLLITIFSILNIIVYVATLIYNGLNPISGAQTVPDSFSNFCQITGSMHFTSQFGGTIYNTIFCFYYTCKIRNPLKTWVQQSKEIHALCFILTLIGAIVIFVSGQIGVSVLGICGLKVTKSSIFIQFSLFILYLLVLIITSIIFLKYLRKISSLDEKARVFFKYYLIYTLLISSVFIIQSISLTFLIIDCFTGLTQNIQQEISKMANCLILIIPIVTTIIICFHPQFGRKIIFNILSTFKTRQNNESPLMIQMTQMNSFQTNRQTGGYLSNIKQINRVSLLSTILGCISLTSSQRQYISRLPNRSTMGSSEQQHIYGWNFNDINQIDLDQQTILENKQYFVEKVPAVSIKFIYYASSVFDYLMAEDNVDFLQNSTNPYNNLQKVYKNAQADGGSSGQFFFFTYDNRILLKSITKNELSVLIERLDNYYHYLKNHSDSFIVKIYGVFTVVQRDTQQQMHFMMMGNLLEDIDRKYMLRIYDCKGSSHKREVFKQKTDHQQPQYYKKTMKDVDFGRLENKVWIKKDISQKIKQTLRQDSLFFYENGLIDYSLIIIKVDYTAYCLDLQGKKPTFNQRNMFFNQKQPHMIYILGIIDYLQTWNVRKKGQRWYKSLTNRSQTISSQSPAFYSQRFIQNLVQKIFS